MVTRLLETLRAKRPPLSTSIETASLAVSARRLEKSYGDRAVLRGFDLEIEAGEIVVVMGPSGSGKSTVLHCLGGLLRPDAGSVRINGSELVSMGEPLLTRFRRQHIGYVFQWHGLLPDLTAQENVAIPSWAAGNRRADAMGEADRLLEMLGLSHVTDAPAQRLSGGEAQRVAVARALVNRPAVLLADEPTASLDRSTKHIVVDLIRSAAELSCGIVIATHDSDVRSAGDRVVRIG